MRGRFHLMRKTDAARRAEERKALMRMLDMESVSHKGPFCFQLGRRRNAPWSPAEVRIHLYRQKDLSELFEYPIITPLRTVGRGGDRKGQCSLRRLQGIITTFLVISSSYGFIYSHEYTFNVWMMICCLWLNLTLPSCCHYNHTVYYRFIQNLF